MLRLEHHFLSAIQKIIEIESKCHNSRGDILMFHQVTDDRSEWDDPDCCITQNSFAFLISALKERKKVCSLDEITEHTDFDTIYVTFDDAYMDVLLKAAPLLTQKQIPYTVFVATSFLGKPKYLTVDALRELARNPLCTIGAHTLTHPMLRMISGEQATHEINESRKILSELIGKRVEYFAYPYGSVFACSKRNYLLVKESGYKLGFSTLNSHLTQNAINAKWFLPRKNVNEQNYLNVL